MNLIPLDDPNQRYNNIFSWKRTLDTLTVIVGLCFHQNVTTGYGADFIQNIKDILQTQPSSEENSQICNSNSYGNRPTCLGVNNSGDENPNPDPCLPGEGRDVCQPSKTSSTTGINSDTYEEHEKDKERRKCEDPANTSCIVVLPNGVVVSQDFQGLEKLDQLRGRSKFA